MHILSFPLFAATNTSFGTDLELIQRHLDRGDRVTVVTCDGALPVCDINWHHDLHKCRHCQRNAEHGLSLLSSNVESRMEVQLERLKLSALPGWTEPTQAHEIEGFNEHETLKQWYVGTFDVGMAVLSSLITRKKQHDVPLRANLPRSRPLAEASLRLYRAVLNLIDERPVDLAYIYNGRIAPMRAIVRACQAHSVQFYTHDRGCDLNHYATFENALPHDLELFTRDMQRAWEAAPTQEREGIAERWYLGRAGGHGGAWYSFISDQKQGQLPANWEEVSGRKIGIFTSSEHEFAAIGSQWIHPLFEKQIEGLKFICEQLRKEGRAGNLHLYIRVHPNQANSHHSERDAIDNLADEHVTVIPAQSPVSTYDLLAACDTVMSFGSTTGIEASFYGTPSVLAGISFYRGMGATYDPQTTHELIELLKRPLEPKARSAAIKYGFFQATRGERFRYYQSTGIFTGTFKGIPLDVRQAPGPRLLYQLEYKFFNVLTTLQRFVVDWWGKWLPK